MPPTTTLPPIPTPTPISLTPNELDDLVYYARTADLPALQSTISSACEAHSQQPSTLLAAALDVDADGLGSRSSLLHFPAANGDVGVLAYLLSLLTPESLPNGTASNAGVSAGTEDKRRALELVNHQNVSGNTALHWAALNGHLACVKALVGAGADPAVRNAAGHDAVYEAECGGREGAEEVVGWMLANCAGLEKGLGIATEEGEGGGGDEDGDEEGMEGTEGGQEEEEEEERKEGT